MPVTLRIIAINDVYSLENLPRLRTLVRHHLEQEPATVTLVTLAGDFVAPSLLSGLDSGRGMVDCLNAVGVTHVSLGNHEDDIATPELHRRIAELRAVWLATNVRTFDPALVAHQIIEVGRVRVGLIGVVMDDPAAYRRPPFGGSQIMPPNPTALAETARLLREQGCACVIPLTHQFAADDRALARLQRDPPFPVILGGHDHTVFLEEIEGSWLVKAGADAFHAVLVDLVWPDQAPADGGSDKTPNGGGDKRPDGSGDKPPASRRDQPRVSVRLEEVANYAEDASVRALVDQHMAKVHALEGATLVALRPGERLSSIGARSRQTSLGTLICSSIRDALGAEGCLINGGGIRASRDYEHRLTFADVKAELPFENDIVVASLPGSVLRDAVAASRAQAPRESGGFLQVDDGMVVDEATHAVMEIHGSPFIDDRNYRIALVRDLFGGMDHQEPLLRFAREHPSLVPPADSGREVKSLLVHAFSLALWKQLGGFEQVDTNGDGVVTEEEIAAAAARLTQDAPSPLTASLVMEALDHAREHQLTRAQAASVDKK